MWWDAFLEGFRAGCFTGGCVGVVFGAACVVGLLAWKSHRDKYILPTGEDRRDIETVKRAFEQAARAVLPSISYPSFPNTPVTWNLSPEARRSSS